MISRTLWLLVELTALFVGVAFAIHLFQRRFGATRLRRWMGGPPLVSALKGIAVGFVTPFCTYSAIPMLVGLRQAGVPPAGYVAFIAAAPVLDPVLFGALVIIVGIEAALVYSALTFTAALSLALIAQHVGIEQHLKPMPSLVMAQAGGVPSTPVAAAPSDTACSPVESPWQGLQMESRPPLGAGLALLRSVGLLLLAGIAVGLLIETAISPEAVATLTGSNASWSIPLAAALGTPLYVQTSLFVPVAGALTNAGVGIGAIVALTIAGAGANVPEFIILTKLATRRLIATFFGYVFCVALVGGLTAQVVLG